MGGGQRFALRLARYVLAERGAGSVRLVCPAASELAHRAREFAVPVTDMDFPPPVAVPRIAARALTLRARLRDRDALVVAGSARCQAVAAAAGVGRRLVHLMHERESAERPTVRFVQRRTGRVVAVGERAAAAYASDAMCNFLLEEDFDRLSGVPGRRPDGTLGVLARLIPEKGVLELIGELAAADNWQRLLVAGPPQDEAYAGRVRARADERVQLLGPVADAAELLAQVDILVVPSVGYEGQPTVILEALAAGRPVVVRESIYSADYAGLAVFGYGSLPAAISDAMAAGGSDRRLVRERFGARQALAVIEGRAT